MRELSDKEGEFCRMVVMEGYAPRVAYALVWSTSSDESSRAAASRKVREPQVAAELRRLRGLLEEECCMSVVEKRLLLARVMRGEQGVDLGLFEAAPTVSDVLAAMKVDNEMAGHNAPKDVNVGGDGLMDAIFGLMGDQGLKVGEEVQGDGAGE